MLSSHTYRFSVDPLTSFGSDGTASVITEWRKTDGKETIVADERFRMAMLKGLKWVVGSVFTFETETEFKSHDALKIYCDAN